jgi:hypothetical protein
MKKNTAYISKGLAMAASHEAGHLMMLWLLDRYAIACIITEDGGLTKVLENYPEDKETPCQRILFAMAGMVLSRDFDLIDDLRSHAADPGYFDNHSDSHFIAEALPLIGGDPDVVLSVFQNIIMRFGKRFNKAYKQTLKLLLEKKQITFDTIHGLFSQWDSEYGLVNRPNSDIVCRIIAKSFRWPMHQGKFIGWDFKPLPVDYVSPKRIGLTELANLVKKQMSQDFAR